MSIGQVAAEGGGMLPAVFVTGTANDGRERGCYSDDAGRRVCLAFPSPPVRPVSCPLAHALVVYPNWKFCFLGFLL